MRSNVSALGNTNRCAFISPLKRARMMRPSSVSNAARTASRLWLERVTPLEP